MFTKLVSIITFCSLRHGNGSQVLPALGVSSFPNYFPVLFCRKSSLYSRASFKMLSLFWLPSLARWMRISLEIACSIRQDGCNLDYHGVISQIYQCGLETLDSVSIFFSFCYRISKVVNQSIFWSCWVP